jgi:hypothetical protein
MFNFTCPIGAYFTISLSNLSSTLTIFNLSAATVYCGSPRGNEYAYYLKSIDESTNVTICPTDQPTCQTWYENTTLYHNGAQWYFDRIGCLGRK